MEHISHLLNVVDEVRDHVALGLMSDPGLSKTSQVKQWAEEHGRQYCELIISQRMPSEISGMPMPVNDSHLMEIYDFETLLKLRDGDVLAFDEFTNGNIQTLNACLTLIQERVMLSGKKLPSLVIVAMGNPQGKCDLLPQTKQRFWWVTVQWHPKTWTEYMKKTWHFAPHSELVKRITKQYQDGFGDPTKYNYYTPRTVENLLRIAMKIEQSDPFWSASDIDIDIVDALYASLEKKDLFIDIREKLVLWISKQTTDPAKANWTYIAIARINECDSMTDLRKLIMEYEREGFAPELIEYMKIVEDVRHA